MAADGLWRRQGAGHRNKAIASPSDGRQITFTCSIYLIIEAMAPGIHIFDKTEEIPVFPGCLEALAKISVNHEIAFSTSTFGLLQLREAAHVTTMLEIVTWWLKNNPTLIPS